jgi:hypothetical protein
MMAPYRQCGVNTLLTFSWAGLRFATILRKAVDRCGLLHDGEME